MKLQRIIGDATKPTGDGNRLIIHICNDIGGWGAGFVLALSSSFPEAETAYHDWHQSKSNLPFTLGQVQFVPTTQPVAGGQITIGNMIAQRGVYPQKGVPPIRYDALAKCLQQVSDYAFENNASVHFPKIGCGLAGGTWEKIEPLIQIYLLDQNIPATLYELA